METTDTNENENQQEPQSMQVADHVSATIIINQLRGQLASMATKHGNNEAAMLVVLSKWSSDVGAIQNRVDHWYEVGTMPKDIRDELTALLSSISMNFNGIKAIGISDLHAHILNNVPNGTTPQCAAANPDNTLVQPAAFHAVNAMDDGTVTMPTIDVTSGAEAEEKRRAEQQAVEQANPDSGELEAIIPSTNTTGRKR